MQCFLANLFSDGIHKQLHATLNWLYSLLMVLHKNATSPQDTHALKALAFSEFSLEQVDVQLLYHQVDVQLSMYSTAYVQRMEHSGNECSIVFLASTHAV